MIDEVFRVIRLVRATPSPPRAHELLQELRDISSMAMEHFDEKIAPILKKKLSPVGFLLNSSYASPSTSSPFSNFSVPFPTPEGLLICMT